MIGELQELVNNLSGNTFKGSAVIDWGSPVPSFGDLNESKVATIGLNPSNREFVDVDGNELDGTYRRFHTLNSLKIGHWAEVTETHLEEIWESCRDYFHRNPYDGWFRRLDYIISGSSTSYYSEKAKACHLDIVPYATDCKWGELSKEQKHKLLVSVGNTLGMLLKNSPVELIVLNGKAVIEHFEQVSDIRLDKAIMTDWTLPRRTGDGVVGYAYSGNLVRFSDIELGRSIRVVGYNHNIQSSFGVTKEVMTAIRNWVTKVGAECL